MHDPSPTALPERQGSIGLDRYGHPHQEVLDRLAERLVLRNDQQGRIHIYSDGRQMWLSAEKNFEKP